MRDLPKLMLGTSPFIGAGQFGRRAREYYIKFSENPNLITEIALESFKYGAEGVQVLPVEYIIEAIKRAVRTSGKDIAIIPTITSITDVNYFEDMNVPVVIIHGWLFDRGNFTLIKDLTVALKDRGFLVGQALHRPCYGIEKMLELELELDVIMVPLNPIGYMYDCEEKVYVDKLYKIVGKHKVKVIAKKTLAAGRVSVEEVVKYMKPMRNIINSIAVGITSKEEARETFSAFKKIFE